MHQNVELGGKFSGTTILFAGFDDHWGIHELGFFMGGTSLQLQTALMPPIGDALRDKTENQVEDDQKHGHIRPASTDTFSSTLSEFALKVSKANGVDIGAIFSTLSNFYTHNALPTLI